MKKHPLLTTTFLSVYLVISNFLQAQDIRFVNGRFKIVQFTDLHYVANAEPSIKSIRTIEATLDAEHPDLVVFTGDIVVKSPSKQGWDEVLQTVISRKIPYIVTLGNHDDESEMTRLEVASYISRKPYLLNNTASIPGVDGVLNASLNIIGKDNKAQFTLYALDSKAYSQYKEIKGYDWFGANQVNWYRAESERIKKENNTTLPALAFFHIPFPEYEIAFNNLNHSRIGVRYEKEGSPIINSGMFEAMLHQGDVVGTFVGHEHVNDYLVDYYGIALAYGCFTGSENTYLRHKNGARIIEIKEGVKGFHTYIRESDGMIVYPTDYPFPKKK
ncbi:MULTISPECIES: metallophosphoesterase family protein [Sphingobacterium]|uniref:metallophosphoesterase family protein n=1 Tax=Sphingobacterium TaxID=28453 RepID=UPI0013DB6176|nr:MULTISPECIES: metallophosphoesterase family protein [unclassified Sphingobacterium]